MSQDIIVMEIQGEAGGYTSKLHGDGYAQCQTSSWEDFDLKGPDP